MNKYISILFVAIAFLIACSKDSSDETPSTPSYTLTVNQSEGGTVNSSGGSYQRGTEVSLSATPNSEFVFNGWSNGSTENPLSITINANLTISANFVKRKYPLEINIQGEGTVREEIVSSGKSTPTEYNSGSLIRLTATSTDGWEFTGWSGSVSGDENPIELSVDEQKVITATFQIPEILFTNRTPNYPPVNNSIGNIRKNYYHPGKILTPDIIINSIVISENCDCFGCGCSEKFEVTNDTSIYFDYNNDGRTDFFGFLQNNSGGYLVGFGKYVLVDDVFNNPVSTYYDSNVWAGGRMELNDFNGDGVDDVLVYHENDHGNGNGGYYSSRIPLEILYFNIDGSFTISKVGPNTSTHDLVSFDIDNDGDVDIVNNEWWYDDPGDETTQLPLFYINDGSGNFSVTNTKFEEFSFYQNSGLDFNFTGVDAFDLDNDGFVDLLIGGASESETQYCVYDNPLDEFEQNCYVSDYKEDIRVFWGSSSFTYSEENSTRVTLPFYENGNSKLSYGFGFIDINNDGEYEIVNVGTNIPLNGVSSPNSGGYLEIFLNNGDRTFSSISRNIIDIYEWDYANNNSFDTGDIPVFYFISVVDVDDDGDFDLIPHTINTGFISIQENSSGQDFYEYTSNVGQNFHWRNDGGYFTLINDRINYQN